jgi:hypothetical protein
MPRQFQKTSVGGMTLEVRTRMLGLFPSEVPPSPPDSAVADTDGSYLRNFHCDDLIARSVPLPLDTNARVRSSFNRFIEPQSATMRLTNYWQRSPSIQRSVRDALFSIDRASRNDIRRHGNFRSHGVNVRGCAPELQLRQHRSLATVLKAGQSNVTAFAGAKT